MGILSVGTSPKFIGESMEKIDNLRRGRKMRY